MERRKLVPESVSQKWRTKPTWYLAYGSNMKASSMTSRKITPMDTMAVEVQDYYLTFDIFGIPFSEPSYASIEAFPSTSPKQVQLICSGDRCIEVPAVCGIAYLLSPQDFHRLLVTEGSGVVYDLVEARAKSLTPSVNGVVGELPVYALKAKHPLRPNGTPSLRYMTLFRDGAAAMKLPEHYIKYLEEFPAYQKPRPGEEPYGTFIFTYMWRPMLKQVVRLTLVGVDTDGNCPQWVAILIVFLYQAMWFYHDVFHRRVFTRGDGGKLRFCNVPTHAIQHE